jgi:hypothetical protein
MKARLYSVLLAGVIAGSMIACTKDLPSGPAHDEEGSNAGSGAAAKLRPANDDFDDAIVITALPFIHRESTVDARTSHDDPVTEGCWSGSTGTQTVWYQFTPSENLRINASTGGTRYDTNIFVFTGTRGNLTLVECNPLPRSMTFDAVAGETYYFLVASAEASGGNLVFRVAVGIEVGVTIDSVGTVNPSTGVVTITGTVTCSGPAFYELGAGVQQRDVQASQGALGTSGECSGVSPWQGEVQGENGRFVPGSAEVIAGALFSANATSEERHGEAVPTTIRLVAKN